MSAEVSGKLVVGNRTVLALRRREVPSEFETRHGANNADVARFVVFCASQTTETSVSEDVWVLWGSKSMRRRRKWER